MIYELSSIIILALAILYGISMKIADLMNEHGLKWFKGDAIFFGFLWGIFGAFLVISNNIIANILIAMNIAFIIRNRLDYLNHQIATSIIIITFLFTSLFDWQLFIIFYAIFLVFGSVKDYVDDKLNKKKGFVFLFNESMWYYPIPTLIYCLIYDNWIVFWTFLIFTITYDLTKIIYRKKGYK